MWLFIISQTVLQVVILLVILFRGPQIFGVTSSIGIGHKWEPNAFEHYSIFFNVFVFLQIFNEINARKLKNNDFNVFKNFFNNKMFFIIVFVTIVAQLLFVQFGGKYMQLSPLTLTQNIICIAIGMSPLIYGFLFKIIVAGLRTQKNRLSWLIP
jgi:Ca2+ transporting ATPase